MTKAKGVDILIHDRRNNEYIGRLKNIESFKMEEIDDFIKRICEKVGVKRK